MHVLTGGGEPLAMLTEARTVRHGVMPVRRWLLNETGDPAADRVALEYNGLLEPDVAEAAFAWLLPRLPGADELVVRNAAAETAAALIAAGQGAGWGSRILKETEAPYACLGQVHPPGAPFEAGLGPNTRAAVRRSARLYEAAHGPVILQRAGTASEALEWFGRMEALHTAQWRARGKAGAFGDPSFRAFHRQFLAEAHERTMADLLRVTAGETEVGYLYSLLSPGGWVMAYQSGFAPPPDNRWKPGYLCHALAINAYAARGFARYDFLAGAAPYKQRLAHGAAALQSVAIFAPRLKFMIENTLRGARNWTRSQKAKRLERVSHVR
jgi:CelD/BcsL family acetyltransferase involved in cellulose biosynthesis